MYDVCSRMTLRVHQLISSTLAYLNIACIVWLYFEFSHPHVYMHEYDSVLLSLSTAYTQSIHLSPVSHVILPIVWCGICRHVCSRCNRSTSYILASLVVVVVVIFILIRLLAQARMPPRQLLSYLLPETNAI